MDPRLARVLQRAHAAGLVGGGDLEAHVRHAVGFGDAAGAPPDRFLDLGSGGGLPGLVLALRWRDARGVLLEGSARRAALLRAAVADLDLGSRIEVVCGRAEELGHDAGLRERFDLVTARAFARPAVTAECGGAFVRPGGVLMVSGRPGDAAAATRWPGVRLAALGLGPARTQIAGGVAFVLFEKTVPCAENFPRGRGIPTKRPLWR